MTLGNAALVTSVGSAIGAIGGIMAGSPLDGMKVGGAIAMQVVSNQQNNEIKKKVCEKVIEGADSAGRKMTEIANSSNEVVKNIAQGVNITATAIGSAIHSFGEKIGETGCNVIMSLSHKYSTMMLISYGMSTLNNIALVSNDFLLKACFPSNDSLICRIENIKSISFSSLTFIGGGMLILTMADAVSKSLKFNKGFKNA